MMRLFKRGEYAVNEYTSSPYIALSQKSDGYALKAAEYK
jgi:hypothetical protein